MLPKFCQTWENLIIKLQLCLMSQKKELGVEDVDGYEIWIRARETKKTLVEDNLDKKIEERDVSVLKQSKKFF